MDHLDKLEAHSVHILREAYREFKSLVMLWSIGKDSTVMLWLARKAFFGHVPIPLVHVDTSYKIPAMIEYRNHFAKTAHQRTHHQRDRRRQRPRRNFPNLGNIFRELLRNGDIEPRINAN